MEALSITKSIVGKEAFNWFRDKVNYHYLQSKKLHRYRNYEKALDLLEDVTNTEIEILKYFGLPETFEFISIIDLFSWRKEIDDTDIKELFKTMKETAESYLLSPAMTSKKILIEAKEAHQTAHDFFALIGIELISYNIFLYESLFYINGYDADIILEEMLKGNIIPADIVIKMNTNWLFKGKLDDEVQSIGLKFWDEFVQYKKNEKKIPAKKAIRYIDIVRNGYYGIFPETFSLVECYIYSITYFEEPNPYVLVELITTLDFSMIPLHVYIPFDEAISMINKATNHSLSSLTRSNLFENFNQNLHFTNKIEIRKFNHTYLYCKGIDLTVTKCIVEENSNVVYPLFAYADDHNYYQVNNFYEYLSF